MFSQILQAAALLEAGDLVAFPTETVYGLGADAENPVAIQKLYAAKGRPPNHPVIVHIAPGTDIYQWSLRCPDIVEKLMHAFWPGPLTLIVPRETAFAAAAGKASTLALRCPAHPLAQALLQAFKQGKGGIAGPSANRFGKISPTTAEHVKKSLSGQNLFILEGGSSHVGIESTILDITRLDTHGPVILRPGYISAEALSQVLKTNVALALPQCQDITTPKAPGRLLAHYAPCIPLHLVEKEDLPALYSDLTKQGEIIAVMSFTADWPAPNHVMPDHPAAYARALYAAMHRLEISGAKRILVETPPRQACWAAIHDRLYRAQTRW